eukprot:7835949-Ditylum_brightwellii.AAC.1
MVFSSILTAEGAVAGGHDLVDTPPADVSPPPKRTRRMPRRKQQQSAMAESTAARLRSAEGSATAVWASASCPATEMLIQYPENSITFDGRWPKESIKGGHLYARKLQLPDAATATTEVGKSRKKRNSIPSSSSTTPARKRGKGRRGASPLQLDPIEGNNDKR